MAVEWPVTPVHTVHAPVEVDPAAGSETGAGVVRVVVSTPATAGNGGAGAVCWTTASTVAPVGAAAPGPAASTVPTPTEATTSQPTGADNERLTARASQVAFLAQR